MKEKTRVLALVRDMGSGNVVAPMLELMREQGHETTLLAENSGQAKNKLTVPFLIARDATELVHIVAKARPDVIITGLSSPRNLESKLDFWALRHHVPLVNIEDYWGTAQRSPVVATLIITIDDVGVSLVRQRCPGSKVLAAGFAGILPVTPRPSVVQSFASLRKSIGHAGAKIAVYPDCGLDAVESLPILVESILRTRVPVILVPKFHPAMVNEPLLDGGTWGEWCERQITPLRKAGLVCNSTESTDELVELADATFSSYSTLLMRAAKAGAAAVTMWNKSTHAKFKRETGLDKTPLMMRGGFPVIGKAQPLDDILSAVPPKLDLKTFDARLAAAAILDLVE